MMPTPLRKDARLLSFLVIVLASIVLFLSLRQNHATPPDLTPLTDRLDQFEHVIRSSSSSSSATGPSANMNKLLFYNRPPKTGSTTIRIAMKKALDETNMINAHCFNMIEWNEMALKTIVNSRDIDFYGCHTRLTNSRYDMVSRMRSGNVTFMTSTRDPENLVLSAYLQQERERNIATIVDDAKIKEEIEKYRAFVERYPIDALYKYHGADIPLKSCPVEYAHVDAMRRVAERFEIVIDLERAKESAVLVEAVTGLKPDFSKHYNVRTQDTSGKMLSALKAVDTSHKTCGNELVHHVLKMQFNIIKDRLLQNRCFTEETEDLKLCEYSYLKLEDMVERTREESYAQRDRLIAAAAADTKQ